MSVVARLDHVTRRFRSGPETVTALDDVTLELASGGIVGLAGPSGSGKSTLLHVLVGWERVDHGTVVRPREDGGWRDCAIVPQDIGLLPELSVIENVELVVAIGGTRRRPSHELLDDLDLGELADRVPHELSLGQQQRLAVARSAVVGSRLVVADEPTAHQDETNADLVIEVLSSLARDGGAVIVSTHDERLLGRLDRVIRLVDGRVSSDAT